MPRPNILFIMTDQQRADTIGAAGNPVIHTPHLDRLCREGVRFSAAYTPAPVCVPARCSLIHGQYAHRTGCVDNDDPMPTDRPTFMQALTEAGYRTHGVGKMHFTPDSQALRGLQTRERSEEILGRLEDDDYVPWLRANGYDHIYDPMGPRGEMYYIPQPAQMPARLHNTQWVGDRAEAFLRQDHGDQPFFLWASFIHPHPPFAPPTPWNKLYRAALMPLPKRPADYEALQTYMMKHQNRYKYRDQGADFNLLRCIIAYYYACISFIDYQVGRMISALEETGQLDNTLVVFTADHGELLGDYGCYGKRAMLDSAARIPLIARYPERFAWGAVCDTPASLVDVFPTLLAVGRQDAGQQDAGAPLDGLDLADLAAGQHADRAVYSQYQRGPAGVYMALNRRWKYFYSAPDRREFLMDRLHDPAETRNRAGVTFCREDTAAMRQSLFDYYRACGYADPLEGNGWRLLPQPTLPADPDAGLLIQDPPWSAEYQPIEGYTE